jgi:hypothetical protein
MENGDKALWINTLLAEMGRVGAPHGKALLEHCGRECLRMSDRLEAIAAVKGGLGEKRDAGTLFRAYKKQIYEDSPHLTMEGDEIVLEYPQCACGMVTEGGVRDSFLCHCTVGYTKEIFEALFEQPVTVELQKSILRGDDLCRQRIRVGGRGGKG